MKRLDILLTKDLTDPDSDEVMVGTIDISTFPEEVEDCDLLTKGIIDDVHLLVDEAVKKYWGLNHPLVSLRLEPSEPDFVDMYFDARQALFDECQYQEVWRDLPLQDYRDVFWFYNGYSLIWADKFTSVLWALMEDPEEEEPEWYKGEVYCPSNRCADDTGVFRGKNHVLVRVDTNTDFNVFLFVLDPAKEVITTANGITLRTPKND